MDAKKPVIWFCFDCPCVEQHESGPECGGYEEPLKADPDLGPICTSECVRDRQGANLGAMAFNVN